MLGLTSLEEKVLFLLDGHRTPQKVYLINVKKTKKKKKKKENKRSNMG